MKKNTTMRIAGIIAMCTVLTFCFVSSTFAKYTSSVEGSSGATVAKWQMKVNGTDITVKDASISFNLFDTINEEDTVTEEKNVAAKKIAPGTGGSFEMTVANTAEVDAKYAITFTIDNTNIPLEFKVGTGEWTTSLNNISDTNIAMNETSTVKVLWRWAFENGNDTKDTNLGIAPETINVTATIDATQID